jgi:hypothetical protein
MKLAGILLREWRWSHGQPYVGLLGQVASSAVQLRRVVA